MQEGSGIFFEPGFGGSEAGDLRPAMEAKIVGEGGARGVGVGAKLGILLVSVFWHSRRSINLACGEGPQAWKQRGIIP